MINWTRVADPRMNMPHQPNDRHPNGQVERDVERLENSHLSFDILYMLLIQKG